MEEKQILLGMTPAEIQEVIEQLGLPKFTEGLCWPNIMKPD